MAQDCPEVAARMLWEKRCATPAAMMPLNKEPAKVQAMPHVRFRPIEAGHNCIISAPELVARELLEIPR